MQNTLRDWALRKPVWREENETEFRKAMVKKERSTLEM